MTDAKTSSNRRDRDAASPDEAIGNLHSLPLHNRHGQVLRGDGVRTRTRILVEVLRQLASNPLAEVTMASVTKELGLNAAAFYRYFGDLGDAFVAAYDCVLGDAERIYVILAPDWRGQDIHGEALRLADACRWLWRRHGPLLRARDSLASAGDARFAACRRALSDPIVAALARQFGEGSEGASECARLARAQVVVAALEATVREVTAPENNERLDWAEVRLALADIIAEAFHQPC